jgi:hypothetical protein
MKSDAYSSIKQKAKERPRFETIMNDSKRNQEVFPRDRERDTEMLARHLKVIRDVLNL